MINTIGLDKGKSEALSGKLNHLLADYMIFYQNVRGLHWNVRGDKFFELHLKFEELYTSLLLKVDEIAERILTLGGTPLHTFGEYMEAARIKGVKDISGGRKGIRAIMDALAVIITNQRQLLQLASEAGDEGTSALMSDYIREQEKMAWMYAAYLDHGNT
jgi:starvation-inducible DNA-binding protein